MEFKAKDIQRLLDIKPIRYEQLKIKANIQPGIEEGEGTGRAHRYSFKNLMEFAIAHQGSIFLPPRSISVMLDHVRGYEKEHKTGLFDPDSGAKDIDVYFIDNDGQRFFFIKTDSDETPYTRISKGVPVQNFLQPRDIGAFYDNRDPKETLSAMLPVIKGELPPNFIDNVKSYLRINLRVIKRVILKRL